MKKSEKCLVWLYMFTKRLFKRISFIMLLCIIALFYPLTNSMLEKESSVLTIAVCSEDDSESSKRAVEFLLKQESTIKYIHYDSSKKAANAVKEHKVDAAWIFKADLEEKISEYVSGNFHKPFLEVVEREDSTLLQLSREMLYSSVFEEVSYQLYKNYAYENLTDEGSVSEDMLRQLYDEMPRNGEIIELKTLDSDEKLIKKEFLTGPIRGIMALTVVLAALAGAMYYLKDLAEGKYDWICAKNRIIPAFASCFTASFFAGCAVCAAICFSGFSKGFFSECVKMFVFIVAATGFALNCSILFKSYGKLGAAIPGLMVALMVVSPVFVNINALKPLQLLAPTYYYLNADVDVAYIVYMIMYSAFIYVLAVILNLVLKKDGKKNFII